MNATFLTGIWQDPVLHMILLQKLETYPPFGAMRDTNIDNVTAAVNRSAAGKLSAPLTRAQVEDRIDRIVATRHDAFANVVASDFTHPDFSRLAALDPDSNINNNRNESTDAKRSAAAIATPSSAKSKRARSTASDADNASTTANNNTALDGVDSGGNVATAALLRDANLVKRVRTLERSWRRYLAGDEKLKEFIKLIYGAIATNKARTESTDNIVAFFRDNFRSALVPSDVSRLDSKSSDELRDVVIKTLEKNSVFFLQDAGDGDNVGAQLWTVGDLAALKLDQNQAVDGDDQD